MKIDVLRIKGDLQRKILPYSKCLVCHKMMKSVDILACGHICPKCRHEIRAFKKCPACATFIVKSEKNCHYCRSLKIRPLTNMVAVYPYHTEIRRAVWAFKFYGKRGLARPMAEMMAAEIAKNGYVCDYVVAAPLHKDKLKERGYDQAVLLAKALAFELDKPFLPLAVVRTKKTKVQHSLTFDERIKNMKNAFGAGENIGFVQGKSIFLVDDVITTGSTISSCGQVLLDAGAAAVYGVAVASAWDNK